MIWKLQPNRVRRAYFGGEHIDALHGDPPVRGRYPEEWIASCAAAFNPDCPKPNEGYSALPDGTLLRDLLAEQNVNFALAVSTDCYIMEKGEIVYHGATADTPKEVFSKYLGL